MKKFLFISVLLLMITFSALAQEQKQMTLEEEVHILRSLFMDSISKEKEKSNLPITQTVATILGSSQISVVKI